MVWEQLAFDDDGSYTQQWKSKLAELTAWGIESLTFTFGVRISKMSDTLTTWPVNFVLTLSHVTTALIRLTG